MKRTLYIIKFVDYDENGNVYSEEEEECMTRSAIVEAVNDDIIQLYSGHTMQFNIKLQQK